MVWYYLRVAALNLAMFWLMMMFLNADTWLEFFKYLIMMLIGAFALLIEYGEKKNIL